MPPICPTTTPASSVPTTLPSENVPNRSRPIMEADRQRQEDGQLGVLLAAQSNKRSIDHRITQNRSHGVPITR